MLKVYLCPPLSFAKGGEHMSPVIDAQMGNRNSRIWPTKVRYETSFDFCSQTCCFFLENDEPWKEIIHIAPCATPDGTNFFIFIYQFPCIKEGPYQDRPPLCPFRL